MLKNYSFNQVTDKGYIRKAVKENINDALDIVNRVRDDLPIQLIDEFLRSFGLKTVNEDGSDYESILTGAEARIQINIARMGDDLILNNQLIVCWHLYLNTGRYDFNCYIS